MSAAAPSIPIHAAEGAPLVRILCTNLRLPHSPTVRISMAVRDARDTLTGHIGAITISTNAPIMQLVPSLTTRQMPVYGPPRYNGLFHPQFRIGGLVFDAVCYLTCDLPGIDCAVLSANDAAIFLNTIRPMNRWQCAHKSELFPGWTDYENFNRYLREDFFIVPDSESDPSTNSKPPTLNDL